MGDYYTEQLVKRKQTSTVKMEKAGLIVMTILAVVIALLTPFGFILVIAAGVADYFLFMRMDVEYEYLYVNGELDIDVIYMKSKRKRKASYNLKEQLEFLTLVGAPELTRYNSQKTLDFSSKEEHAKVYQMMIRVDRDVVSVLFEPNQTILDGIRQIAPSKVKF